MNTILNVPGKTKDRKKIEVGLALYLLKKRATYKKQWTSSGSDIQIIFRTKVGVVQLGGISSEVPHGYFSNLSRCVKRAQKFSGMKSHDCDVFMQ